MTYARGEEAIARMYEGDYGVFRRVEDVRFYVEEAERRGGPVAEFACGTGRVLCPTAGTGVEITGIDVSPAMLAQARANLAAEGLRAELVEGDMRTVDLDRTFRLVTLPFRPLQHLVETEDQLAALSNLRRHLEPGGTLILDVFQPKFSVIAARGYDERLAFEREADRGGSKPGRIRRFSRAVGEPWRQVIHVYFRWEIESEGRELEKTDAEFDMRWFTQFEMEHLLARTGFSLEAVYGSFDREPVGQDASDLIFVAAAS